MKRGRGTFHLLVLALLAGCSAQDQGGVASDAVDTMDQSLGETACTTYPAPPVGTQNTNIGNYNFHYCDPAQLFWSQSYDYNPTGCPRQYIFQINADASLIGLQHSCQVTPVYGGPTLTSSTCPTAHVNLTVWRWKGFPTPEWVFPPVEQFTTTGSWENGQCVFRRDDTGSSDLTAWVDLFGYQTTFRAAVQVKRGSNYHSAGLWVNTVCIN